MSSAYVLRENPHPAFPGVTIRVTVEPDDRSPFSDLFDNAPGRRYHSPDMPYMAWDRPTGDARGRSVKVAGGRYGPLGEDAWYVAEVGGTVDRPDLRRWLSDVARGDITLVVVTVEAIFNGDALCGNTLGGVEYADDGDIRDAVSDYGLTPSDDEITRGLRDYIESENESIERARVALGGDK